MQMNVCHDFTKFLQTDDKVFLKKCSLIFFAQNSKLEGKITFYVNRVYTTDSIFLQDVLEFSQ